MEKIFKKIFGKISWATFFFASKDLSKKVSLQKKIVKVRFLEFKFSE